MPLSAQHHRLPVHSNLRSSRFSASFREIFEHPDSCSPIIVHETKPASTSEEDLPRLPQPVSPSDRLYNRIWETWNTSCTAYHVSCFHMIHFLGAIRPVLTASPRPRTQGHAVQPAHRWYCRSNTGLPVNECTRRQVRTAPNPNGDSNGAPDPASPTQGAAGITGLFVEQGTSARAGVENGWICDRCAALETDGGRRCPG